MNGPAAIGPPNMRKESRLRKSKDFALVYGEGRRRADQRLVVIARRNGLRDTRFGFVTSKRIGNAVVRNRTKRKLREAARLSGVEAGWDVVAIARRKAPLSDYRSLDTSLRRLMSGVGVKASGGTGRAGHS